MDDEINLKRYDISRRRLLKVAGTGVGVLALGGGGIILGNALSSTPAHAASGFIKIPIDIHRQTQYPLHKLVYR